MGTNKPLRFAVIGTGLMGSLFCRILRHRTDVTLQAIADLSPVHLEKALVAGDAKHAYADFRDMLADQHLDAVIVATPDDAHLEPCLAVLAAGAHLFVEKPLARTSGDADAIVGAAQEANRILAVGHTLRFDTAYGFARGLVQSGQLGRVVHIYARRNASLDDGFPGNRAQSVDPMNAAVLPSLAHYLVVHDVDAVHWITGVEHRVRGTLLPARFSPGLALLTLAEASDGSAAVFESSWIRPAGPSGHTAQMLEVVGTDGMVEIIGGRAVHYWRNGSYEHPQVGDYGFTEAGLYGDEIEDFVTAVRENRPPLCSGADGAYAVRVADAVLAASSQTSYPDYAPLANPTA